MNIVMTGIDHNRAGIDERSRYSFTRREMAQAYEWLRAGGQVLGCVILSTCNRTELWLSAREGEAPDPVQLLKQMKAAAARTDAPEEPVSEAGGAVSSAAAVSAAPVDFSGTETSGDTQGGSYAESTDALFETRVNEEAIDHLFYLASGLRSQIVGEDQILTQVKDALVFARENRAADHVLEVLFRQAATAGKRVKSEVHLSRANRTAMDEALDLLAAQGFDVNGRRCMVIGNGMMGRVCAQTLTDRGAHVTVTVRQYRSGVVDIPFHCERINYADRYGLLPDCELVVSATASPNYTLTRERMEAALKARTSGEPIYLLDMAVPRDIEPSVRELPGLKVYDIDDFHTAPVPEEQAQALEKAARIITEEEQEVLDYVSGRDLVPRIQKMKEAAARDMDARLSPLYRRVGKMSGGYDISAETRGACERMMNKMLFSLRDELPDDQFRAALDALERIFPQE